jgi:diguanylate cyclase (GGDEF)-like protein/PAS domain S-box-containing protein
VNTSGRERLRASGDGEPSAPAHDREGVGERLAELAAIVRASSDAIFTLDPDGVITTWNQSAERMYGYAAPDVIGCPSHMLWPSTAPAPNGDFFETSEHVEHARKDATLLPVALSVSPLFGDEGTAVGSLVIARDLTERLLAQTTLTQSEARLREVEALAHVGSWSLDVATGEVQWSEELHKIRNLSPYEFDGTYEAHTADVHPDDRPAVNSAFQNARQEGAPFELEYREIGPDGEIRFVHARCRPAVDASGKVIGIRGIYQDITDHHESEQRLRTAYEKVSATVAEMERRSREQAVVGEMADMLQSCLNTEEAYGIISAFSIKLFPDTRGAVYRPTSSLAKFEGVSSWGNLDIRDATVDAADCWALRRGRPHRTTGQRNELTCRHARDEESKWTICLPLLAHGELLGLLHLRQVTDVPASHEFDGPEVREALAVNVTEHLALALANLKLRDHLKSQSELDSLTGLFNRRFMDTCLQSESLRATYSSTALSLLLIDVDDFKVLNDSRGHAEGDAYLKSLADVLVKATRSEDTVCRYGGDEFAIILPDIDRHVALQRAEQLCTLAESELGHTISIGLASIPQDGSNSQELFHQSDVHLYQAKVKGKNQVVG